MIKYLNVLSLSILLSALSTAALGAPKRQGPTPAPTFQAPRFAGPAAAHDEAKDMAVDSAGNVYIAGSTEFPNSPALKYDALLVKYSSSGSFLWQATYNGPGSNYDCARQVAVDDSGNPILVGESPGTTTGTDVFVCKYSPSGAVQWTLRWNSGADAEDNATVAATAPGGDIYVAGERRTATGTDLFLIKVSSSGTLLWQIVFDSGAGDDTITAMSLDASGNIYVAGSLATAFTGEDAFAAKVTPTGGVVWIALYDSGFGKREDVSDLKLDSAGNVFVAGTTWKPDVSSPGDSLTDMFVLKLNGAGAQQWVRTIDGGLNDQDQCEAMSIDSSGNAILAGSSYGGNPQFGGTDYDFLIAKVSSTGSLTWLTRHTSAYDGHDYPRSIVLGTGGTAYIAGFSWQPVPGTQTFADAMAIIKVSSAGVVQSATIYQGAAAIGDAAVAIRHAQNGNFWVVGNSYGLSTGLDIVLLSQAP